MNETLHACSWVYNKTLDIRREAWSERGESVSLYTTIGMIPEWKKERPQLGCAHSHVLQNACMRVDIAFQSFFKRVKRGDKPGYPRFKNGQYKSFTYTQSGYKITDDKKLYLSKIGKVKIRLHRLVEGKVKMLTVQRDTLDNWYACFVCIIEPKLLPPTHRVIGVDVGLTHFATLSTGEQIDNPRFFRKDEKELAKAQRRLSGCKKGSAEYCKYKRVVQHIHKRIANRRHNFAHQLSRRLVNEFQVIAFEDLDIQSMQNGNYRGMNKSISDAAWCQFMDMVSYKAENDGRISPRIDPRGTTQMCSDCGKIVRKDLSIRVHDCPHCGLKLDRDHNAALNILARGMASLGFNP